MAILRTHDLAIRSREYTAGAIFFCYNDYRTHVGIAAREYSSNASTESSTFMAGKSSRMSFCDSDLVAATPNYKAGMVAVPCNHLAQFFESILQDVGIRLRPHALKSC